MVPLKSHSLTSVNGRSTQHRTLEEIIPRHVPQEPHSQMKNDKNQNIYGIYLTTKPGNNPKIFTKQVEKQAVLFPYCGILLSSIKESTDTDHPDDLRCIMPSERNHTHTHTQKKKKTVGLSSNMGSMCKIRDSKRLNTLWRGWA